MLSDFTAQFGIGAERRVVLTDWHLLSFLLVFLAILGIMGRNDHFSASPSGKDQSLLKNPDSIATAKLYRLKSP
jgi:hypothetical protein